ncbi:MAG: endonuclease [Candidatus Izemoplasmatales bacterium]|nr:endonuclease [Candidatus Izemoplasmatales bacterium]
MLKLKRLIVLYLLVIMIGVTVGCDVNSTSTTTETFTDLTTFLTETTTTNGYIGIEVTEVTKTEYEYKEAFYPSSITVIIKRTSGSFFILHESMYTVTGFDSSIAGEIELTVSYGEFTDTFTVTILEFTGIVIDMEYYSSVQGLTVNELFLELRTILNDTKTYVSYDDARYILDESDADPNIPGNIILVYLGTSISGVWDYGATWNREHIWPQSLLSYDSVMSSDLHNLKPSNPSENSSRGNKYYDYVETSATYEPPDEVKGDVARILLYMWTMYEILELVDSTPSTYQMALLTVLLEWHELDPVDDFERNRNEVIYSYQHNRNPYIDYPEFVKMIWG